MSFLKITLKTSFKKLEFQVRVTLDWKIFDLLNETPICNQIKISHDDISTR